VPVRDVSGLLSGVGVPAELDADRNLGEHLHDLPAGNGGFNQKLLSFLR
jgi:hypothetical protein